MWTESVVCMTKAIGPSGNRYSSSDILRVKPLANLYSEFEGTERMARLWAVLATRAISGSLGSYAVRILTLPINFAVILALLEARTHTTWLCFRRAKRKRK